LSFTIPPAPDEELLPPSMPAAEGYAFQSYDARHSSAIFARCHFDAQRWLFHCPLHYFH
jgi:hypothetical protein